MINSLLDLDVFKIVTGEPSKAGTHVRNFEVTLRAALPIWVNLQVFVLCEEIAPYFFHVGLQRCVDPLCGILDD